MKLLGHNVDTYSRPIYIAEISGNHDGTEENIIAHIAKAVESGADAVKLQTFYADEMTCNNGYIIPDGLWKGKNLYDLYNDKSIVRVVANIFDYCSNAGINLFSSVFGFKSLALLERLGCPAYKISSFENNWPELIEACIATGKPVLISTGAGGGCGDYLTYQDSNIILMHCVSSYPAKLSETDLWKLHALALNFEAGFSDHTIGTKAAEYAVVLGARVIEKHFALDYKSLDGYFSATPEGFKNLVKNCNAAFETMQWDGTHSGQEFKRSWYFIKDMTPGQTITKDDVAILRPALGMKPDEIVIGMKVHYDIKAGTPVIGDMLW